MPKLSSVLDKHADEKYYISDAKEQKIIAQALERLESLKDIHPTITPDRADKRQNGRRAKENEAEVFTLTAQDIHGVITREEKMPCPLIVQTPRGKNTGNIHKIAPTLTSNAYQENNFVLQIPPPLKKRFVKEQGCFLPMNAEKH